MNSAIRLQPSRALAMRLVPGQTIQLRVDKHRALQIVARPARRRGYSIRHGIRASIPGRIAAHIRRIVVDRIMQPLLQHLQRVADARRQTRQLGGMNDHELADLGINRNQLDTLLGRTDAGRYASRSTWSYN